MIEIHYPRPSTLGHYFKISYKNDKIFARFERIAGALELAHHNEINSTERITDSIILE